MRVAVMQPYLFPYLGYFQLIRAVDLFVLFDDVQYIKRGWVNRNRYLEGGTAVSMTAEVLGASQLKDFRNVEFGNLAKLERRLEQAYRRAPEFDTVFPLIQDVLRMKGGRLRA